MDDFKAEGKRAWNVNQITNRHKARHNVTFANFCVG